MDLNVNYGIMQQPDGNGGYMPFIPVTSSDSTFMPNGDTVTSVLDLVLNGYLSMIEQNGEFTKDTSVIEILSNVFVPERDAFVLYIGGMKLDRGTDYTYDGKRIITKVADADTGAVWNSNSGTYSIQIFKLKKPTNPNEGVIDGGDLSPNSVGPEALSLQLQDMLAKIDSSELVAIETMRDKLKSSSFKGIYDGGSYLIDMFNDTSRVDLANTTATFDNVNFTESFVGEKTLKLQSLKTELSHDRSTVRLYTDMLARIKSKIAVTNGAVIYTDNELSVGDKLLLKSAKDGLYKECEVLSSAIDNLHTVKDNTPLRYSDVSSIPDVNSNGTFSRYSENLYYSTTLLDNYGNIINFNIAGSMQYYNTDNAVKTKMVLTQYDPRTKETVELGNINFSGIGGTTTLASASDIAMAKDQYNNIHIVMNVNCSNYRKCIYVKFTWSTKTFGTITVIYNPTSTSYYVANREIKIDFSTGDIWVLGNGAIENTLLSPCWAKFTAATSSWTAMAYAPAPTNGHNYANGFTLFNGVPYIFYYNTADSTQIYYIKYTTSWSAPTALSLSFMDDSAVTSGYVLSVICSSSWMFLQIICNSTRTSPTGSGNQSVIWVVAFNGTTTHLMTSATTTINSEYYGMSTTKPMFIDNLSNVYLYLNNPNLDGRNDTWCLTKVNTNSWTLDTVKTIKIIGESIRFIIPDGIDMCGTVPSQVLAAKTLVSNNILPPFSTFGSVYGIYGDESIRVNIDTPSFKYSPEKTYDMSGSGMFIQPTTRPALVLSRSDGKKYVISILGSTSFSNNGIYSIKLYSTDGTYQTITSPTSTYSATINSGTIYERFIVDGADNLLFIIRGTYTADTSYYAFCAMRLNGSTLAWSTIKSGMLDSTHKVINEIAISFDSSNKAILIIETIDISTYLSVLYTYYEKTATGAYSSISSMNLRILDSPAVDSTKTKSACVGFANNENYSSQYLILYEWTDTGMTSYNLSALSSSNLTDRKRYTATCIYDINDKLCVFVETIDGITGNCEVFFAYPTTTSLSGSWTKLPIDSYYHQLGYGGMSHPVNYPDGRIGIFYGRSQYYGHLLRISSDKLSFEIGDEFRNQGNIQNSSSGTYYGRGTMFVEDNKLKVVVTSNTDVMIYSETTIPSYVSALSQNSDILAGEMVIKTDQLIPYLNGDKMDFIDAGIGSDNLEYLEYELEYPITQDYQMTVKGKDTTLKQILNKLNRATSTIKPFPGVELVNGYSGNLIATDSKTIEGKSLDDLATAKQLSQLRLKSRLGVY